MCVLCVHVCVCVCVCVYMCMHVCACVYHGSPQVAFGFGGDARHLFLPGYRSAILMTCDMKIPAGATQESITEDREPTNNEISHTNAVGVCPISTHEIIFSPCPETHF